MNISSAFFSISILLGRTSNTVTAFSCFSWYFLQPIFSQSFVPFELACDHLFIRLPLVVVDAAWTSERPGILKRRNRMLILVVVLDSRSINSATRSTRPLYFATFQVPYLPRVPVFSYQESQNLAEIRPSMEVRKTCCYFPWHVFLFL